MGTSLNIVIPGLQVQNRASPAAGNTRAFPVYLQSSEIPVGAVQLTRRGLDQPIFSETIRSLLSSNTWSRLIGLPRKLPDTLPVTMTLPSRSDIPSGSIL